MRPPHPTDMQTSFAPSPNTETFHDIDFNNDSSLFDPCDTNAFLMVYAEGPCSTCGE